MFHSEFVWELGEIKKKPPDTTSTQKKLTIGTWSKRPSDETVLVVVGVISHYPNGNKVCYELLTDLKRWVADLFQSDFALQCWHFLE